MLCYNSNTLDELTSFFFKNQDAYTTEDIIYKWKYKDVKVEATKMAQFDYKRASLSTSEDMYKIGKSYFCYLHYCRPKASKLMMSQLGERTSVKEYSLGRWLLSSGSRKFNKPKSSASVCSPSRFEEFNFLPTF